MHLARTLGVAAIGMMACGCGLLGVGGDKRADNPKPSSRAADAPAARKNPRKQRKQHSAAMAAQVAAATAAMKANEEVPPSVLDGLEALAAELGDDQPDAVSYVAYVRESYRRHNALVSEKRDVLLAEMFSASVVAIEGGASIAAAPGKCYVALVPTWSIRDPAKAWRFKTGAVIQRFLLNESGARSRKNYGAGFCTEDAAEVVIHRMEGGEEPRVVLETTRDDFSPLWARDLEVEIPDRCDVGGWKAQWLRPLPGALVYGATQPLLSGGSWDLWQVGGHHSGRRPSKLSNDFSGT